MDNLIIGIIKMYYSNQKKRGNFGLKYDFITTGNLTIIFKNSVVNHTVNLF